MYNNLNTIEGYGQYIREKNNIPANQQIIVKQHVMTENDCKSDRNDKYLSEYGIYVKKKYLFPDDEPIIINRNFTGNIRKKAKRERLIEAQRQIMESVRNENANGIEKISALIDETEKDIRTLLELWEAKNEIRALGVNWLHEQINMIAESMFPTLSVSIKGLVKGTYENVYTRSVAAFGEITGNTRFMPVVLPPEKELFYKICPRLDSWLKKEKTRLLDEIAEEFNRQIHPENTEKAAPVLIIVGGIIIAISVIFTGCSDRSENTSEDVVHAALIEALKDSFIGSGIEEYKIVASGKESTCEQCEEMNGKVFKVSEFVRGETAPPFHPNCRCTIEIYMPEEAGDEEEEVEDTFVQPPYSLSPESIILLANREYSGKGNEKFIDKNGVQGIPLQILEDGKYTYGYGHAVDSKSDAPAKADADGWMSVEDALELLKEDMEAYCKELIRILANPKGGDLSNLQLTQNEVDALIILCYNRPAAIYAIKTELSKDRSKWDYQSFFNTIMNDYPNNPKFRTGWENRTKETLDLFFKE